MLVKSSHSCEIQSYCVKFKRCEIQSYLWNPVIVVEFSHSCEIPFKMWNSIQNVKFQSKLWNYTILDQFELITEEFRPVWNLPRNTVDEKIKKSSWTMCHQKRGQIGGRDSLGDCDNICEGNLVFRVIFGKFMHRWFQICAQLGSCNVFFLHYTPPKLKYCFFRGSFSQPTSKSKWVGEPD